MRKLVLTLVAVGLAMAMTADASAGIFGWRRRTARVYVQPAPVTQQAQAGGYRSFSYQPVAQPVYRYEATRQMNAWDYPKTDARRYNGGTN
jgi:hypothetical protein